VNIPLNQNHNGIYTEFPSPFLSVRESEACWWKYLCGRTKGEKSRDVVPVSISQIQLQMYRWKLHVYSMKNYIQDYWKDLFISHRQVECEQRFLLGYPLRMSAKTIMQKLFLLYTFKNTEPNPLVARYQENTKEIRSILRPSILRLYLGPLVIWLKV
jgi:hypothetical protein